MVAACLVVQYPSVPQPWNQAVWHPEWSPSESTAGTPVAVSSEELHECSGVVQSSAKSEINNSAKHKSLLVNEILINHSPLLRLRFLVIHQYNSEQCIKRRCWSSDRPHLESGELRSLTADVNDRVTHQTNNNTSLAVISLLIFDIKDCS